MYFNPRSPRGGATDEIYGSVPQEAISIHAPHEGERQSDSRRVELRPRISIHAPHEGERRREHFQRPRGPHISIHAPHEGERLSAQRYLGHANAFQSTLPTRGSDRRVELRPREHSISIHAPHEGERRKHYDRGKRRCSISIHAPHEGERHTMRR